MLGDQDQAGEGPRFARRRLGRPPRRPDRLPREEIER